MLHPYLNQSQINGVAWMGLNLYDYNDFQKNQGGYRIMKTTVCLQYYLPEYVVYELVDTTFVFRINKYVRLLFMREKKIQPTQIIKNLPSTQFSPT